MENSQIKKLCVDLIKSDKEDDVINLLRDEGYWENQDAWRFYGDYENNYNVIGNQQSRPDAALVEKLVNSIDARLLNECLIRQINPESDSAPKTIRESVAIFFEENPESYTAGLITEWADSKRTEVARGITLVATGAKPSAGFPCFTISDCGEGQTPEMMPYTLLSLNKDNKLRIPFVQGKFNMGGTGVLKFCGHHNLQLIVSRRNPDILNGNFKTPTDLLWGVTIVRREDPKGGRRSSVYTYLAPSGIDKHPGKGGVLSFNADSMPIFPEGRHPYGKASGWGTLIKLYEYNATGFKSHILLPDGLLSRMDLLLPALALPIRFHECRDYKGHSGSTETTVTGLNVRLGDDKAENIEENFPLSCPMNVGGEKMTATIYAFKKGKAGTYRKNEGIMFTVNGQTHGHFTIDFFRRTKTGCSYLRDSLLVIVDCSDLSGRAREDLFMNSRDRLSGGELRSKIEKTLEVMLKDNKILRMLKERRQREQRDSKIDDSKPLEDMLKSILKKSPTLSQMFLQGTRISNPFKTVEVQAHDQPYKGKRHPTFFKFKGKNYGFVLRHDCHIDMRVRVTFESDVVNDYFGREIDKGEFALFSVIDDNKTLYKEFTLNMQNGIATLNLELPSSCAVGDELHFEALVKDRTLIEPFENSFVITVREAVTSKQGKSPTRRKPPSKEKGSEREMPLGIQLPRNTKVYENPEEGHKGWHDMTPPFDKYSALGIIHAGDSDEDSENGQDIYDFYINMDNVYLKNEQKNVNRDPVAMNACFLYGMILFGIALIHDELKTKKSQEDREEDNNLQSDEINIERKVENFTKAVAPILIPMIDNLGNLEDDIESMENSAGEAT